MKRRIIITLLACICVLLACNKKSIDSDDFSGDGFLTGRLMFEDDLSIKGLLRPLPKCKVYIAKAGGDSLNYLYSTVTDSAGYFAFQYLKKQGAGKRDLYYDVFFRDNVDSYMRLAIVKDQHPNQEKILLIAHTDKTQVNGIAITLSDSNKSSLPFTQVCVFSSLALAKTGDCSAAFDSQVADALGHYTKYNIQPGRYYISATLTKGGLTYTGFDSIDVSKYGFIPTTVWMSIKVAKLTGFRLTVIDSPSGTPINAATTCVHINRSRWLADTCEGSIFNDLQSNAAGITLKVGIDTGTYYLRTTAKLGGITRKSLDMIRVIKDSVLPVQIQLK